MRRCLTALANSPQSPGPRALGLSNREHRLGGRFTFGHMETGEVGTVQELWRFPVKSMQGERLDGVAVSAAGLLGDGAYAIVDRESGKVASAKHPKLWPQLLDCRANFTRPPQLGEDLPPVQSELADGTSVTWVGHTAAVWDELRLIVAIPNGRCVMKTAAQPG